jgi:hypothetical protein
MGVTNPDMSRCVTGGKPPLRTVARAGSYPLSLELTSDRGVGHRANPPKPTSAVTPGQRFGRWTVLQFDASGPAGRRHWLCRCECGNEKSVKPATLKDGKSKSCGCERGEYRRGRPSATRLEAGEASLRDIYRMYANRAARRGMAFDLTKDQFRSIVTQPCEYCGQPPVREHKPKAWVFGGFICNGVDRWDNAQGYTHENCRPCCPDCNLAKGAMAPQRWSAMLDRIAKRRAAA